MFGKRAGPTAKPKRRWFFKIRNIADAEEAIKICYQTFYALAAIQAVVLGAFYVFWDASFSNLFDPILMLVLAWFIEHKKSRTAAVMLGVYTALIAVSTLGNKLGANPLGGFGGKNIVLAALALYGAYKGLQGTFKYHTLAGHRVIVRNVWKMVGLLCFYNVAAFVILFAISVADPRLEQKFWGYGEGALSDDLIGGLMICLIFLASAGTAFRILPWTKNRPLVAVNNGETNLRIPN